MIALVVAILNAISI